MNIDNQTFHLKQEILVRLVKAYLSDDFAEKTRLIPYDMRPQGAEVPYRCCIYKERAIIKDRIIAGLGFQIEADDEVTLLSEYAESAEKRESIDDKNLTVLQQACKGCASNTILVTDLCQGCVARPCEQSCKFGAISVVDGKSVIDQEKCKNCQMCVKACPYHAIVKATVPCEDNCPVGAIKKDETGFASIDYDKCISCGKCIVSCPFGSVHEKSQIIAILKAMKSDKKVIALIAPSIAGQFPGTMYQLKSAIKKAIKLTGNTDLKVMLKKAVKLANDDLDDLYVFEDNKWAGWTGHEALAIAIYCALKYDQENKDKKEKFKDALIASVNHNGDSDSTGAILGNILGAYYGVENLPFDKEKLECYDILEDISLKLYQEIE